MKVNNVSLKPVEYRVLVLPDPVGNMHGEGILYKADQTVESDIRLQVKGTIVALSDVGFKDWDGMPPKVGDRILYAKYAGQEYIEEDVTYYIMNDNDVVGILKEKK